MAFRRGLFGASALIGAFLLFQIQPMLGRWILPWFGGGTAVWTTCTLFFQTVLFAGYAYAHASERMPAPVRTAVHLALLGGALALLPVAPGERWKPDAGEGAAGPLLALLAATAGLPCLALASTGPLVQAWAARAEPGRSPYRLYALSNAGSLAALLTYPFLVEPRWGLRTQSTVWAWSFALYAAVSAVGLLAVLRAPPAPREAEAAESPAARPWGRWIALPAAGSALMLATTNQLGQDIAVLPFLWVLPLAVYLVTFILAFDRPGAYRPEFVAPATAALALASAVSYYARPTSTAGLAFGIGLPLAALLGACLLCHGELARLRPAPRGLTGYYLAIAGGGALGGLLVGAAAPLVFSTLFEWKLGIALAFAGACGTAGWTFRAFVRARPNIGAVGVVAAGLGFAVLVALLASYGRRLDASRNFYGAVTIDEVPRRGDADVDARDMTNGRVVHGRQILGPMRRRLPTTYYAEASGVGRALARYRSRPDLRLGVVGLGAGTLAAYITLPTQSVRFYEINPEVPRLARRWFTFLDDCPGRMELAIGDARLSLEREPPQGFHVLALDAFSGHTVPTHLLTVEAVRIFLRHVRQDGILAVHVSNQFLRLGPVARGAAHRCGLRTLRVDAPDDGPSQAFSNSWMLCARDEETLRELRPVAAEDLDGEDVVWTDDASDLFSVLRPRARP